MSLPITFIFKSKKEVSLSEVFAYSTEVQLYIYIRNMFLKFRVFDGENIVKISRGIVEQVHLLYERHALHM